MNKGTKTRRGIRGATSEDIYQESGNRDKVGWRQGQEESPGGPEMQTQLGDQCIPVCWRLGSF